MRRDMSDSGFKEEESIPAIGIQEGVGSGRVNSMQGLAFKSLE